MPPRTRTLKKANNQKENAGVILKSKEKAEGKNEKPVRKVLADKTNSASDDNASVEVPKKVAKKVPTVSKHGVQINDENRPRRERRLPKRFANNEVLINLSNSKETPFTTPTKPTPKDSEPSPFKSPVLADNSLLACRPKRVCRLPSKFDDHFISPSKYSPVQPCHASTPIVQKKIPNVKSNNKRDITASKSLEEKTNKSDNTKTSSRTKVAEISINVNENIDDRSLRTRRVAQKTKKASPAAIAKKTGVKKTVQSPKKVYDSNQNDLTSIKVHSLKNDPILIKKVISPSRPLRTRVAQKRDTKTKPSPAFVAKKTAVKKIVQSPKKIYDSNQNDLTPIEVLSPIKNPTPIKKVISPRKTHARVSKKSPINYSFRLLETKKTNEQNKTNDDVYEFTYDPNEEPPPQKKKKRIVSRKRPAKPKVVTFKNNYDENLSKTLTALKNVVSKKPTQTPEVQTEPSKEVNSAPIQQPNAAPVQKQNKPLVQQKITSTIKQTTVPIQQVQQINAKSCPETVITVPQKQIVQPTITENSEIIQPAVNNFSIPIEDIAANLEATPHHDINYSPVHISNVNTSNMPHRHEIDANISVRSTDPLNIRGELSFFDDEPVASSSMNVSVRHPHASPWRAEFNRLPIKWHVNSYVKPNMTPAVECSFVNFNEGKKHVYTNMVPEADDVLPEIVQNEQPSMMQTSILSFYKDVVENSAKKNGRKRSRTPAPTAIFDDISNTTSKPARILNTPRKSVERSSNTPTEVAKNTNNSSNEQENSRNRQKHKNKSDESIVPAKAARKEKDSSKENTFFGFDESEDLENISPKEKVNEKARALRSRSRAVLKEINEQNGPTRALIPRNVKTRANLDVVNKLYDGLKSAEEAPYIADKNIENTQVVTATAATAAENDVLNEDSQSVHLFEDIEFCHHFNKPQRKSYGKAKKVTIRQPSSDDSDSQFAQPAQKEDEGPSSEDDNVLDLTFEMPAEERKTKKKAVAGKKKISKKQMLSKKEAAEAEAWAAGFNSMCEDVEEFPLVLE